MDRRLEERLLRENDDFLKTIGKALSRTNKELERISEEKKEMI